jgi:hypothetical protein
MDHPLLTLQATAYCAQRASQNALREYFILHKELNGWKIVNKSIDRAEVESLQRRIIRLRDEVEQEFIGGVMNAKMIDEPTWSNYFERKGAGEAIGTPATNEMIKFELRHFYNEPVTPDLIKLDDDRRFRECIMRFESLHIHNPEYLKLLHHQWTRYHSDGVDFATSMGNRPLRSLEAILIVSGLIDDNGLCDDKVIAKADLHGFLSFCNERRVTIERDLDVNLRKDRDRDPVKTLNLCLDLVGLEMDCLGKTRKADKAVYRYRLHPSRLATIRKIVERRKSGPRSTLPEVLEPPRFIPRKKPMPDCRPVDILGRPEIRSAAAQFRERRAERLSLTGSTNAPVEGQEI